MKLLVPVMAAALAVGGAANAAVEMFSYNIASTPVPFSDTFTLSAFDTALGTLTGVKLTVDDTTAASVGIYNINATAQAFSNASATVPLTVSGPGGVSLLDSVTAGPISGVAAPGASTFAAPNASNIVSLDVGSGSFSNYESATPLALQFTADAGNGTYTGTGGFGLFFGGSANAGGTVTVQYTYDTVSPAPEPAAWAMMIVGFGMMGGVLRRRSGAAAA